MTDKRILMVIAPSEFRDEEFFEPYDYFTQDQHWSVTVASTAKGEAKGMLGKTWTVQETLDEQDSKNFDAMVIVGGMGSLTYLWDEQSLQQLIRQCNQDGKVVAAICLSGAVLANAGILEGKSATVWEMPESIEAFRKGKATYIKQDVVVDGNIVTSNGPHAAKAFAHEIARQLLKVPTA